MAPEPLDAGEGETVGAAERPCSTDRGIPIHVPIEPPEGGLKNYSVILCDAVRSIAKERLTRHWGRISPITLAAVEDRLRILMGL